MKFFYFFCSVSLLWMLVLFQAVQLAAQNTATASIGSMEAEIGEQVAVPFTVVIPGNFQTFQFRITYDPDVLYLQDLGNFHPDIGGVVMQINNDLGRVTFNFLSFTPVNLPGNTKLLDLLFDFCIDEDSCQLAGYASDVAFDPGYANQIADFDIFFNPIYYDLSLIDGSVWGAEPISGYTVSFLITDTEVNPINNASVTLGNQTNEPGQYVFNYVEEGQYTYTVAAGGYETAEGVLDVFDDIELEIMLQESDSSILYLQDIIVGIGETQCYDATETIIVAGNGSSFFMEAGSSVHMLAGKNIVMKAGTMVSAGSHLHAFIDPESPYCDIDETPVNNPNESTQKKDTEPSGFFSNDSDADLPFIIFPNPGKEKFTVELTAKPPEGAMTLEVFNFRGELIINRQGIQGPNHVFTLTDQPTGIYLVRVASGANSSTQILIKN